MSHHVNICIPKSLNGVTPAKHILNGLLLQYSQKETPGLNLVFNQFGQILAKFTCKLNATKFAIG